MVFATLRGKNEHERSLLKRLSGEHSGGEILGLTNVDNGGLYKSYLEELILMIKAVDFL